MPRRRKLETTTARRYIPSDVNVICAMAGLRFKRTRRYAHCYHGLGSADGCPLVIQNTRYVVTSGARKKEEDWDPEENGGYAVHGA